MGNVNYKKVFAIQKANEKRILNVNPDVPNRSGIYFLTRTDEEGFRYAYIGQASRSLLYRLGQHLSGFQRIDISIKAHGLYSADNIYGWKVGFLEYPVDKLDEMEQHWIKKYAESGYQLRNVNSGGNQGKKKIDEYKPSKTYTEGKEAEKKRISKELAHLFELHLDVTTKKNPPTVNQQKALYKFNELLEYHKNE